MKFTVLLLASLLLLQTGCTTVKNSMRVSDKLSEWNPVKSKKDKSDEDEIAPAETMAVIWKDAVLESPTTPPVRGFGGRIYFYDKDNNAVQAEGDLMIYAFDNESQDGSKPKRFIFKSDSFQSHFSESALGGSYSVWIPWGPVAGSNHTSVTLIPVFRTADNRVLKCGQSVSNLPGSKEGVAAAANAVDQPYHFLGSSSAVSTEPSQDFSSNVAQTSFAANEPTADSVSRQSSMRSTSISLPRSLQRRIAAQPQTPTRLVQSQAGPITANAESGQNDLKPVDQPQERTSSSQVGPRAFGAPGTLR